ncbi:hypothetical protein SERLA73DRAFT_155948 [Serpula lacrymans var. lacrymans S7.3]|uniref:Phosducin domain-containing protein n=2 Tax=Serpula lacrymans var. lacrymans TaxID=341189 RepID=F8QCA1_SERL3|nr:uncharacterized protein SERLADRAFT_411691 [Serpula lacrymans var. lacrymans S7.9]EGN94220.1 hypothetical protein SERLA73DRAFT_155948 [Serpula lacrymans var. lacrymans S7.3]EGO19710.1 hypothetical protein SERLADRAFT_411691 [Serpula lacrymans var. lacrymans S7.9]
MDADIEHLVLSGKLFNPDGSRSSSPERSPSPDHGWHDDENPDDDSDGERSKQIDQILNSNNGNGNEPIGMGPGRTGVKGVIRDRFEADALLAARRARAMREVNRRMEKASLGGRTYLEEEQERAWEKRVQEGESDDDKRDVLGRRREGRFGHLREVGKAGFVPAVEKEERGVWVVIHLYESSLDRCYALDDTLARLARIYPQTKFLRARASALGFASTATSSSRRTTTTSHAMPGRYVEDDEDPYDYDEDEKAEEYYDDDEEEEQDVDTDMLPTMLVYRDGELVHNWVRVDWEAGKAGVEDLLSRRHIIGAPSLGQGNCGLPSDDEDDLVWSDEEDVLGS